MLRFSFIARSYLDNRWLAKGQSEDVNPDWKLLKLPRKSRHLDLTREEVSDAESRGEEN